MATGIICEYNPFHKGHLYHIQTTLARTANAPIICVMSGHYVQRAEPALFDKWTRTRMALAAGASLVLELPTYYSTATAEWFAFGALSLLHSTGLIQTISFGIENPSELPALQDAASHLQPESPQYRRLLRSFLTEGTGFAHARSAALEKLTLQPLSLEAPNTILVLEYLRALKKLHWHPSLLPLHRVSAGYHDPSLEAACPSATALRRLAAKGTDISPYLPDCCRSVLPASSVFPADLFSALSYRLCFHTPDTLREIDEVAEGLENRILAAARHYPDYEALLSLLKTKRYPTSRLRRILLNILLDIKRSEKAALRFEEGPAYIRVLGFRRDQQALLSQLASSASLPVVTNLAKQLPQLPPRAKAMLQNEIQFSRIYAASAPRLSRDCEYRMPLVILD